MVYYAAATKKRPWRRRAKRHKIPSFLALLASSLLQTGKKRFQKFAKNATISNSNVTKNSNMGHLASQRYKQVDFYLPLLKSLISRLQFPQVNRNKIDAGFKIFKMFSVNFSWQSTSISFKLGIVFGSSRNNMPLGT